MRDTEIDSPMEFCKWRLKTGGLNIGDQGFGLCLLSKKIVNFLKKI